MRRLKYAATFLSIVLSVLAGFYWYRSTTTATDACILYLSPTHSLLFVTDDAALFVYVERREPPIRANAWAETPRIAGDSRYRIGDNLWAPPRIGMTSMGIGWGRDQRPVLEIYTWDSGLRIALPLLVGLFLILPAVRAYRALRRRRRNVSAELSRDLG